MKQETKIHFMMVFATILWAGAFIAGKIGIQEFSSFGLTFFRFVFATILIFIVLIIKEKNNWKLDKSLWPLTILLGIIGMFGYHILFFTALKYTTAINSSIIGATNPLFTTILAAIFFKETLNLPRLGAMLLAFSGVILTVTDGKFYRLINLRFNFGDIIMLIAVICWAVYSILGKRASGRVEPLKLLAHVFLVCLILMVPFMIKEKIWLQLDSVSWQGWTSVIYMGLFPSFIGYLIQLTAIQRIGASRSAIYINLVPVFSMILSYFILHEAIGWFNVLAVIMIVSGVYISSKVK